MNIIEVTTIVTFVACNENKKPSLIPPCAEIGSGSRETYFHD